MAECGRSTARPRRPSPPRTRPGDAGLELLLDVVLVEGAPVRRDRAVPGVLEGEARVGLLALPLDAGFHAASLVSPTRPRPSAGSEKITLPPPRASAMRRSSSAKRRRRSEISSTARKS